MRLIEAQPTGRRTANAHFNSRNPLDLVVTIAMARDTVPSPKAKYIDTAHVQLAFRHLRLNRIHSHIQAAAEAGVGAAERGRFWPFDDALFARTSSLDSAALAEITATLGAGPFSECMRSGVGARQLAEDGELVVKLQVHGTTSLLFRTGTGKRERRRAVRDVISPYLPKIGVPNGWTSVWSPELLTPERSGRAYRVPARLSAHGSTGGRVRAVDLHYVQASVCR